MAVVTLLVDDFDERLASAAAAGIEVGPVETVAGSVRTTWITDPDGNRVQIGQPG
jgi:catechol 2,3-dioxygenase-like lactoylglutathione lyase family enzyme